MRYLTREHRVGRSLNKGAKGTLLSGVIMSWVGVRITCSQKRSRSWFTWINRKRPPGIEIVSVRPNQAFPRARVPVELRNVTGWDGRTTGGGRYEPRGFIKHGISLGG